MKNHVLKIMLPISLTFLVAFALATIYWNTTLTNTGTIIAYGCKIYLEDKLTENYQVNWDNIPVNGSLTQYRWIYNNGTGANIQWSHDAPSYLQLKTYYEQPEGTWNLWNTGTTPSFSPGQWLHMKLELTALSDAIGHVGAFNFIAYIELT